MAQDERYVNLTKEQVNYINKIVDFSSKTKRQILLALDKLAEAAGGGGGGVDTYLELTDTTDSTFVGAAGQVPTVNVGETGLTFETPSDTDTDAFLDLTDVTESSFVGAGGQAVTVNVGETGLEFSTAAAGGGFEWSDFNETQIPLELNKGYPYDYRGSGQNIQFPETFEKTTGFSGDPIAKYPIMLYLSGSPSPTIDIEDTGTYENYYLRLDGQLIPKGVSFDEDGLYYCLGYVIEDETNDLYWDMIRLRRGHFSSGSGYRNGSPQILATSNSPVSQTAYKTNFTGGSTNTLADGAFHGQLKKCTKIDGTGNNVVTPTSANAFVSFDLDTTGDTVELVWNESIKQWTIVDYYNNSSGNLGTVTINT